MRFRPARPARTSPMSRTSTTPTVAEIRLQKVLAQAGLGSRRKCDDMIASGRVEVNGEIVDTMGARVDPVRDVIRVDGARIPPPNEHAYLILNKPRGVSSRRWPTSVGGPISPRSWQEVPPGCS